MTKCLRPALLVAAVDIIATVTLATTYGPRWAMLAAAASGATLLVGVRTARALAASLTSATLLVLTVVASSGHPGPATLAHHLRPRAPRAAMTEPRHREGR
jgi:hypothetical protein